MRESLPSRGAWIEINRQNNKNCEADSSLPSRGAWIEITHLPGCATQDAVAPLAGSVD